MSQHVTASDQATPEQLAARIRGDRLAVWNDLRRRIDAADTLAELRAVEESIDAWEYGDDLKLNQRFERRWSQLDKGRGTD